MRPKETHSLIAMRRFQNFFGYHWVSKPHYYYQKEHPKINKKLENTLTNALGSVPLDDDDCVRWCVGRLYDDDDDDDDGGGVCVGGVILHGVSAMWVAFTGVRLRVYLWGLGRSH